MSEQLPGIGKIHEAIAAIMGEVGGVAKTRENKQQNYKFRGIADITKACQPLMSKNGVHVTPHAVLHEEVSERKTKGGADMLHIRQRIEFRFYHSDGSYFPCVTTGEAMDTGDKTSNKCMAAALKYALSQTFCIPEDDPDADTENSSHEIGAKRPEPPKPEHQKAPGTVVLHVGEPRPANGLTNEDIKDIGPLAKRAGYLKPADLVPILREMAGVESLKAFPRNQLADLKLALEKKGDDLAVKDVEEVFGGARA